MLFIPSYNSKWQQDSSNQARGHEIKEIEQLLSNAGIRVPSGSRLDMYKRSIQAMNSPIKSKRYPTQRAMLHTLTELREINLIIRELSREPEVAGWREKMMVVLGGREIASDDRPESPARDTQFELYLAAALRSAKFDVTLDEPDVTFNMNGQTIGIAAKRIKSAKLIEKRVKKAGEQIVRTGLPGIIALDASFLHDYTKPIMANHIEAVHQLGTVLADNFAKEYVPTIIKDGWVDTSKAFCILVCVNTRVMVLEDLASKLGLRATGFKPITGFRWTLVNLCHHENEMSDLINVLAERLSSKKF